jgi:hypothetical protein
MVYLPTSSNFLIFCILCCLVLTLITADIISPQCGSDRDDEFRMVNMTSDELSGWYGNYDLCVLRAGSDRRARAKCRADGDMECSSTHTYDSLPLVFYQQPVDKVTGQPYPKYSAIDTMIEMNRSHKMLVLFGDSISREFVKSLYCSMRRENGAVTITPPLGKSPHGVVLYDVFIPLANGTLTSVRFMFCSIYAAMGPADVGEQYFTNALKNFVWKSIFDNSTNSAVVLFNIGLHEHGPSQLGKMLNYVFKWSQSDDFRGTIPAAVYHTKWGVTGSNPGGNLFIYREASQQDYPVTPESGFGKINMRVRQLWLNGSLPFPTCTPFLCGGDGQTAGGDSSSGSGGGGGGDSGAPRAGVREVSPDVAAESTAIRAAEARFEAKEAKWPVPVVPFRNYARHFWATHPASKFRALDPKFRNILSSWTDCTHYTHTALIHHPAWSAVWKIIRTDMGLNVGGGDLQRASQMHRLVA